MNTCLVSTGYPPEDGGGIGTYIHNLALGLRDRGHRVFVITQSSTHEDREETIEGITVFRIKGRYLPKLERFLTGFARARFMATKVNELDRRFGLDLIEFPNWEAVGFVYLLQKRRKPVVVRVHTPYFETLTLDKPDGGVTLGDRFVCWTERRCCLMADCITASTRDHRRLMAGAYRMPEEKIHILPLGIDLSAVPGFAPRPPDRKLRVLYVSRLEKRKGTKALLEAIPMVLERHSGVEFVFIGSDRKHAPGGRSHRDYFQATFPGFGEQVQFLGYVSDEELARYYRESDLFVVPSVYESFGLIYVEAMARGLPVIGGNAGGIPEVIADGETGYLVPVEDSRELAARICQLLERPDQRERMGQAGTQRVRQLFTREIMAANTERLYQEVVSRKGGGAS